jgi:hypothetical protein
MAVKKREKTEKTGQEKTRKKRDRPGVAPNQKYGGYSVLSTKLRPRNSPKLPDTVKGLQATSVAMTTAQRELSTALRNLSDSRGAVVQIESANNRLTYSLDNRAKAVDALLREVRSDLLRLWIPLIAGATLLIGLFGGMSIPSWRDSVPTAATPTPTVAEPVPLPESQQSPAVPGDPKQQHHRQAKAKLSAERER